MRAVKGQAYGLDFGSILMLADAMGARSTLLADVLPAIEPVILKSYQQEGDA
ncbi:hypothetical protein [Methylobacterium sp. J-092]|uniref:DUF7697 family protein n=1 Tax=Methylobacterium sp. J-092 TaxID=2836667 RepID=UPI001FB8EF32|nr:hypothetical protein [Methylobacterium sp. J-092]MCJ2009807.1 hypothetical protein [Methylobacterium sp. J-092]